MPIWLAFVLGAVQGLTEFLPVSSSGHLVMLQTLFKDFGAAENEMMFDLLLHLGTVIAVIVAFWPDIVELFRSFFGLVFDKFKIKDRPGRRFLLLILMTIVPMLILLPFMDTIEALFTSPVIVGPALIITAAILLFCDGHSNGEKDEKTAGFKDAFLIGLSQIIATVPGISRSGTTMTAAMGRGFKKDFAVRFSFIMSLPVILGANLLTLPDAIHGASSAGMLPAYIVGIVSAAVFGFLAIKTVRCLVNGRGLWPFAIYCAVVGIAWSVYQLVL